MKSPWKYLAELASLGRKVKATERPPETASTTGEASPTPEEHSRAPVAPTKEVGSSEVEVRLEPEPSTEESETPESATITTVDSPRSDAYALERVPSAQPRSRKVQRPAKTRKARPVAMFETAQPIPSGLPLSLSEEIAVVDEEVMELRRQLAEKLRLQNKQLEVLLKRFDAP